MKATAKNTANGLVVSNESPIFALPKHLFVGHIKSYKARLGVFLLHFCSYGGGALASIGGTPSFYTLIVFNYAKAQHNPRQLEAQYSCAQ